VADGQENFIKWWHKAYDDDLALLITSKFPTTVSELMQRGSEYSTKMVQGRGAIYQSW
jgi:hypothetical protein